MQTSWQEKDNSLIREFIFHTFMDAIAFINKVAGVATELNHHPEIWNVYNKIKLTLSTHDAGDIVTDKDRELAAKIDMLL